jgi:2-polyprenyl-3-methyl-5-hydroxy-6-metoxy-1,4-benzoquinol methylase
MRHLPAPPASVLDVGAGSGRDAAWLAGKGYSVLAVEPSATMREEAQGRHAVPSIVWMDDRLPSLDAVLRLGAAFDLILVSAVWMHVQPAAVRGRFASW